MEAEIAGIFRKKKKTLGIAESCTGGLVSHRITNVQGSSRYFKGGFIAYSDEVKMSVLSVPREMIRKHGAVSRQVARAMAEGVRRVLRTDCAASVTGIAGPGGGTPEKPVGLAYISVASGSRTRTRKVLCKGDRAAVKYAFSQAVLGFIREVARGNEQNKKFYRDRVPG